jgi:transposase-like protein
VYPISYRQREAIEKQYRRRQCSVGRSWRVDETYVKIKGQWASLDRAGDKDGHTIDCLLAPTCDRDAAEAFFRSARTITGSVPERCRTDGHSSYPGAIKAELGEAVIHRTNRYLNNHLEQDHRGIKQRTWPMGGFKHFVSAARFCWVYEEVRNFFRARSHRNEPVSLLWQRRQHLGRLWVLLATLALA